jgi:hypothetical protein
MCSTYGEARLMAGQLPQDQLAIILGIGATAARHALDVEIGVRIPDPQLRNNKSPKRGLLV